MIAQQPSIFDISEIPDKNHKQNYSRNTNVEFKLSKQQKPQQTPSLKPTFEAEAVSFGSKLVQPGEAISLSGSANRRA